MDAKPLLRDFFRDCLNEVGDRADFTDADSLFASGRLDSLALTRLVLFLEAQFQVDFARVDFSADRVDSVDATLALLQPLATA